MLERAKEILSFVIVTIHKTQISVADLIGVVIIFVIVQLVLMALRATLKRLATSRTQLDKGKRFTIVQLARYILYVVFVYIALDYMGFDPTALLVASGAFFVAAGLGLQKVFLDIVSGIVILLEGSIQVGDIIELDGLVCKVQRIDLRTSKVVTRDGNYITIPNGQIVEGQITNWSMQDDESRFKVCVGVAYGSDTQKVKELLIECAEKHPDVLNNRQVMVFFQDFGDSALIFDLYFWAKQSWTIPKTLSDIRFAIDQSFRENKITIPFPQRDLWVKQGGMPS